MVVILFIDIYKDHREIKDTTGLVAIRVCITDANAVVMGGRNAIELELSYIDLWGEEKKETFAIYGYSLELFTKGDSITMYQDPFNPEILKYKKNFEWESFFTFTILLKSV